MERINIKLNSNGIGALIAAVPYVDLYAKNNKNLKVDFIIPEKLYKFTNIFKDINFTFLKEDENLRNVNLVCFSKDNSMDFYKRFGMKGVILKNLGFNYFEKELYNLKARFDLGKKREINEKYVCISCQASRYIKIWSNKNGWNEVVDYLKSLNYRVLCIDKDKSHLYENGIVYTIPENSEDFTGDKPLQERIDLVKDADFFIGLPSGLSWLADSCNIPVILISGFSNNNTEFFTPYRVFPKFGCKQCLRAKNICDKDYECHKNISSCDIIEKINKIIKNEI